MSDKEYYKFDIFLSYNHDHKSYAKALYNKLTNELNFKVWMDDMQLSHDSLQGQLGDGIINSRVFLCCITKKYSESVNCQRELGLADTKKKPKIILMLERYSDDLDTFVQMIINNERR